MPRTIKANGEKLKQLRAEREWDQQDLADEACVSLATIQSIEKQEPVFRSTLVKIAKALGKSYQELLEGPDVQDDGEKRYDVTIKLSIPAKAINESKNLLLLVEMFERVLGGLSLEVAAVEDRSTLLTIPMTEQQIRNLIELCPDFRSRLLEMSSRGANLRTAGEQMRIQIDLDSIIKAIVDVTIPEDAEFLNEDVRGETIAIVG